MCLVAVKRFPENTYFLEMLISRKGKYFHGVWLHFKKFSGKYFLVFGKEERKTQIQKNTSHNPEKNHQRRQIQSDDRAVNRDPFRCLVHSNIFTENASNQAKETKTQQKKMNQRRATSGAMSDERRAVRSSIDERTCWTRTAHRSRRSSIDERCDRPDDRTARSHRSPVDRAARRRGAIVRRAARLTIGALRSWLSLLSLSL